QGGLDVVVHVDRNADGAVMQRLQAEFQGRRVAFAPRVRCGWGTFSLVQAALNGLRTIAGLEWQPDYVVLMSGADFPIRPAADLHAFLESHTDLDFIESIPLTRCRVRGGLQHERFE